MNVVSVWCLVCAGRALPGAQRHQLKSLVGEVDDVLIRSPQLPVPSPREGSGIATTALPQGGIAPALERLVPAPEKMSISQPPCPLRCLCGIATKWLHDLGRQSASAAVPSCNVLGFYFGLL